MMTTFLLLAFPLLPSFSPSSSSSSYYYYYYYYDYYYDYYDYYQVRVFAIMGSAAFTGGIMRMMLSLTVIMMEVEWW